MGSGPDRDAGLLADMYTTGTTGFPLSMGNTVTFHARVAPNTSFLYFYPPLLHISTHSLQGEEQRGTIYDCMMPSLEHCSAVAVPGLMVLLLISYYYIRIMNYRYIIYYYLFKHTIWHFRSMFVFVLRVRQNFDTPIMYTVH